MVKYLVKETSTATADNPSFANEVSIWYYGKGEHAVKRDGTHAPYLNFDHTEWMVEEYGYTRKCDAKKAYAYKNPSNSKYWTSTVEIVEVEYEPHIKLIGHNFVY